MPSASINFPASTDTSAATVSLALSLLVLTGPIDWPFTPNYCSETGTIRIVCVTSARHLRFFGVKFLLITIRAHSIFQTYAIVNLDLNAFSMRGRCTRHRNDVRPVRTAECITAEYRNGIKIYYISAAQIHDSDTIDPFCCTHCNPIGRHGHVDDRLNARM